jgi:hypothetical protein
MMIDKVENNSISPELGFSLLYKYLREQNLLYEYCYEIANQRKNEIGRFIEGKPMREQINYILHWTVKTYCEVHFRQPFLVSLLSWSYSSFDWVKSQKGHVYWFNKAEKWGCFVDRHFWPGSVFKLYIKK